MEEQQNNTVNNQPMKVSDWLLTIFLSAIPLIGLIMLFIWAFGSDTPTNKANWAKAMLLWIAIIFVLYFLIFIVFGGLALLGSMGQM